jgi:soluble lytic murein transglycosylase
VALKTALAQLEAQFRDAQSSKQQVDDEAVANAMEVLLQNGGRYSELPVSVRSRVPAAKRVELLNYAERVAKGDDSTDPAVYLSLMDDRTLKGLTDQQFYQLRARLSESDFQQLAKERSDLIQGGGEKSPQSIDRAALKVVLDDRLQAMGINPNPGAKASEADRSRTAAINSFVRNDILRAQLKAGHKFSDAEIEKHVDGLFAKSVNMTTWGMFGLGEKTAPRQMITMRERDIPDDIRTKIKTGLKQRGVEPTEGAVLGVYWDWKRKRGG